MSNFKFKKGDEVEIIVKNKKIILPDNSGRKLPAEEIREAGSLRPFADDRRFLPRRLKKKEEYIYRFFDLGYYFDSQNIGRSFSINPILRPPVITAGNVDNDPYTQADAQTFYDRIVSTSLANNPIDLIKHARKIKEDGDPISNFPAVLFGYDNQNEYDIDDYLSNNDSRWTASGLKTSGKLEYLTFVDSWNRKIYFPIVADPDYFVTDTLDPNAAAVNFTLANKADIYIVPGLVLSQSNRFSIDADPDTIYRLISSRFAFDHARLYEKNNPDFKVIPATNKYGATEAIAQMNYIVDFTGTNITYKETGGTLTLDNYSNLIDPTGSDHESLIKYLSSDLTNGEPQGITTDFHRLWVIIKQNNQTFYGWKKADG